MVGLSLCATVTTDKVSGFIDEVNICIIVIVIVVTLYQVHNAWHITIHYTICHDVSL